MYRLTLHEKSVWLAALLGAIGMGMCVATCAWHDLRSERRLVAQEVGILSDVTSMQVAASLHSPLASPSFVKSLLSAIERERYVHSAAVYPPANGEPWVWVRPSRPDEEPLPRQWDVGQYILGDSIVTVRELPFPSGYGRLVLEGGFESVSASRADWWSFGVRTVAIAAVLVYIVAGYLMRRTFEPIERLRKMTVRATRRTSSVRRLEEEGPAEVAGLAAAFNDLLDSLVLRDKRLARVRADFERELQARTAELTALNEELSRSQAMAQAAADTKAEFLANMSHEIRTPMNAVIGMTSLLLETQLEPEQRSLAEKVRRSGEGLLDIINDILDFSKIEAGKLQLEETGFHPREVLEEAVDMVAQVAQEKGIELATVVPLDVPDQLIGDPGRLRQILLNFLGNAVKFTEEGEIVVSLTLEGVQSDEVWVRLAVRDSGIGIPKDRQQSLFETFTQVDASTTRRYGGTGLGLAISQRLAQLMGGSVELDSEQGEGSTFWCRLRFKAAPSGVEPAPQVPEGLAGRRILVVQENPAVAEIHAWQVSTFGGEAWVEHSAYTAYESLMRDPHFDLVILDTEVSGVDAFLGALAAQESLAHINLLLLSPLFGRAGLPVDARIVGNIGKPIKREQLQAGLCKAFGILAPNPEEERASDTADDLLDTSFRERVRILLVEDNDTNQQLVQYLLGKRGYRVDIASNGRKAVDAFLVGEYDIVLMDCQMPEMDGFEATKRIREIEESRGHHVPILAMTANALEGDRERCHAAGMDDYVAKPIQPRKFVAWLEGWIYRTVSRPDAVPPAASHQTSLDPDAIDRDVLGVLLEDDDPAGRELASELIQHFLGHGRDELASVQTAAMEQDWERCARLAHGFVSSCGTVGAMRCAALLRRIEGACGRDPENEVPDLLQSTENELGAALTALQFLQKEKESVSSAPPVSSPMLTPESE